MYMSCLTTTQAVMLQQMPSIFKKLLGIDYEGLAPQQLKLF